MTDDILDPSTLANAVQGISAIIHLAAVKAHAPDARFIMSSTTHVYNKDNSHPGKEDDPVDPQHAYPASKVAAEKELRESGLNWSVLRFPFVYSDGDGHLGFLSKHVGTWHRAQRMSTIHHCDIAQAVTLALGEVFDRRIASLADEAPSSIYELAGMVGKRLNSSCEPLSNPWYLHVDTSRARSLCFRPSIRTVYQAWQEGIS